MPSFKKATNFKYAACSKIKLFFFKNITVTVGHPASLLVWCSQRGRGSADVLFSSWRPVGCSEVVSNASLGQLKCDTTIWAAAFSLQRSTSQFYNILSVAEHWYQPATFTKTYSIGILASTCTHTTDKHIQQFNLFGNTHSF